MVRGAAWISAALLLGIWAHGASKRDAIDAWKRGHPPSERVWDASLAPLGFARVRSPDRIQRAIRGLPLNLDSRGSAWHTQDGNWVAVLGDSDHPPLVLSRAIGGRMSKTPIAADWQNAGLGWEGFESLLRKLEALGTPKPVARAPHRKSRSRADPRAIVY